MDEIPGIKQVHKYLEEHMEELSKLYGGEVYLAVTINGIVASNRDKAALVKIISNMQAFGNISSDNPVLITNISSYSRYPR